MGINITAQNIGGNKQWINWTQCIPEICVEGVKENLK